MVSRVQEQLPELLALAHDRSEGARLHLAGKLTDLFLVEDTNLSEREESLVDELIDQLLKNSGATVRRELVKKFADAVKMPRKMALRLSSEAIDVAQTVLSTSETLTDEDLITVIETQSNDHACAVATRRRVTEAVADALVTTGDIQIMQIVAENLGAKLSPRAIGVLSEAARLATKLQQPILQRPELTQEIAAALYWWVTQDLRRIALQRFNIASGQLDLALAKAIDTKLSEHVFERNNDESMLRVADWLDERKTINAKILPQLLRMGHFRLFNIALSRLCQLGLTLVDGIVAAAGGRTLAVLCRAINIDKSNFVSIFLLSRGARPDEQIVHPRELSYALAAYDRLQPDVAQTLLHSWRENPDYLLRRNEETAALEA